MSDWPEDRISRLAAERDAWKERCEKAQSELARAREDAERMDWLEQFVVEVRVPLVHGTRHLFIATPEDVEGGPDGPSDIRQKIDYQRNGALKNNAAQAATKADAQVVMERQNSPKEPDQSSHPASSATVLGIGSAGVEQMRAMLSAAPASGPAPIPANVSALLENAGWTRILEPGAIASFVLKELSPEYLKMKGAELEPASGPHKVICHAPGGRCGGCDHYKGLLPECIYKEPASGPSEVWEVASKTTSVLFATEADADAWIGAHPGSVSGGMFKTCRSITRLAGRGHE